AFVDEAFRSYARYWVETLRVPKPGLDEINRRTTMEGMDALSKLLDAGRGVLFVSPHTGSLDVAGGWLASHGWRVVAVAEDLEPPELFDLFARLRRSIGIEVHAAGSGASARALLNGLRTGAGVVLDPIEVSPGRADPDRVRELTERIARGMEELIKREPGQWHLFQPNWPSDPGYRHG